ncbi:glycosyl hydrolases family 15-domain-containing protein [Pilobolus umbonatus]|nr:glycosyl hydrolases family 15-domain-containing protein [Pilobolus umbonatus]
MVKSYKEFRSDRLDYYYNAINSIILGKQHPASGLIPASTAITIHGNYTDAWVRDNVYSIYAVFGLALAYRRIDDNTGRAFELQHSVIKLMRGLLFAMMRQSHKVEQFKQSQSLEHSLHAKYNTTTGDTVVGDFEWGHLQIDATSLFVLALADMTSSGFNIIYSQDEVDFIQNLVFYIERAYRTPDYGIWERGNKINHGQPELNSSSIGMALAALRAINGINLFGAQGGPSSIIHVLPDELTRNSTTLHSFLPRESNSKEIDASVLSIIGFPAFAVDVPELVSRTRNEAIKKLEGDYGMKRFLRDGHQTALEDTSRLYYNAHELKIFEDIESEWPLFFTYLVLEGLFTGDLEQADHYQRKLLPLIVESSDLSSKDTSEQDWEESIPLLPELYYVPAEHIDAEKRNPHSQKRLPNDNIPLVWALSLYYLGRLIREDLLSPSEVDPLGRRFNSSKMTRDTIIQIVVLSEDRQLQNELSAYGLETQTLDQLPSTVSVLAPEALSDVYCGLGLNSKMSLTGRPKRPIGVLGTCRLYRIQGQIYAFTPHFIDNDEFYINSDPDYLVSDFESELRFTKENWFYHGRPTLVVLLSHDLLGTNPKKPTISMDAPKKHLLNFFSNLRCGSACNGTVPIKLCRLAETINTSNIQSLDYLIKKPEINWERILHGAHASRYSTTKRKLGYSERKTQANTPGHRTPYSTGSGGRTPKRINTTFNGKSLASPINKLHDETYFQELASALSKLKSNDDITFKLKAHEDSSNTNTNHRRAGSIMDPSVDENTQFHNKPGSVSSASPDEDQHSINDMLSLTLGDTSHFDQAVDSLNASVNLYDQIDILQYLVSCKPSSYYINSLDASLRELLEEVYLKSMRLQYWSIARQAAGLLHKNVPCLTLNLTDLIIRQKQISIGSGPQEYLISMPVSPETINKMINEHCSDDVREGPVVQEIIIYLGKLIRTQPNLFEGILRLRTHYIIIALREEISRINHTNEEEAVEHLMQLSPFELQSLLNTILSGPTMSNTNNQIFIRDGPGGLLMLPTQPSEDFVPTDNNQHRCIPLLTDQQAQENIVIRVQSAGYHSGNLAKVNINGTVLEADSRGIHVWALDRKENIIMERASFDTHISSEESIEFAKFIHTLSPGMIIVIACKDEFTEHLGEEAKRVIEDMGSQKIRHVRYRDSYVFIGEKGNTTDILEEHRLSTDGPTGNIEKVIQYDNPISSSILQEITPHNMHHCFPHSNGCWLRRRKNDGALNRVSSQFFPQVWSILSNSRGFMIRNHTLPREPTVLEMTPEEFNFALAVESYLGMFSDPAERQIAVELLTVIHELVIETKDSKMKDKMNTKVLDLSGMIVQSIETFWNKWSGLNKMRFEKNELFKNGMRYQDHRDKAHKLFFDLPSKGTESTYSYLKQTVYSVLT